MAKEKLTAIDRVRRRYKRRIANLEKKRAAIVEQRGAELDELDRELQDSREIYKRLAD